MELPVGSIIMWFKPIAERPVGWELCDGNNSTPDLRGKFVMGVSADGDRVATTNDTHVHTNSSTVAADDHTHDVTGSLGGTVGHVDVSDIGTGTTGISPTHTHTVDFDLAASGTHQHTTSDTNSANNLPPYVQVYYIMRKL